MTKVQKSLARMGVFLLVAVIAVVSIVLGRGAKDDKTKQKDLEAKAFEFEKTKVKKLVFTARGATTTVEKDGEGWRIVDPIQARADRFAIDPIVDKLADLKSKEVIAEDRANEKEFGLDAPQFIARVTLDDGKELVLSVGAENTFDQSLYYAKEGDPRIFQADSGLKQPLDKALLDLRDKAVVTHDDKDVQSLEITSGVDSTLVERDGDGWKLVRPIADGADKSLVDGLLGRFHSARAKAFPLEAAPAEPGALAPYGLEKPAGTVVFAIGADRAKKTLHLGFVEEAGAKKYFARLAEGGPVLEVEEALFTELGKPAADLRDKTIAAFDRDQLTRLDVTANGATTKIVRTREKVGEGETDKFTVDGKAEGLKGWKLTSAVYTLANLKGVSIVDEQVTDLKKYGLDAPLFTFTAFGEGDKELVRLLIGALAGTRHFAMKAGGTKVFEIEKSTVDDLPKSLADATEAPPAPPADPSALIELPSPPAAVGE